LPIIRVARETAPSKRWWDASKEKVREDEEAREEEEENTSWMWVGRWRVDARGIV